MAKVRGASFLGTLDYVQSNFGETGLRRVLEALPSSVTTVIGEHGQSVLNGLWYDAAALSELTRTIDRVLGTNDLSLARAAGRHVAFSDVNRFFKWLLKLGGPKILFARASAVWSNYYDCGTYVFEGAADTHATVRIEDFDAADEVLCKRFEGWVEKAFELTAGSRTHLVIRETHHRAPNAAVGKGPYCRFEATWQ